MKNSCLQKKILMAKNKINYNLQLKMDGWLIGWVDNFNSYINYVIVENLKKKTTQGMFKSKEEKERNGQWYYAGEREQTTSKQRIVCIWSSISSSSSNRFCEKTAKWREMVKVEKEE